MVSVKGTQLLLCSNSPCNSNEYEHVGYEFFPIGNEYIKGNFIQLSAGSYLKILNLTSLKNVQITITDMSIPDKHVLYIYYGNYGIKLTADNINAAYNRFNLENVVSNNPTIFSGTQLTLTMCRLYDADNESADNETTPSWSIQDYNSQTAI